MTPNQWLQVKEIFNAATELAPTERRRFLRERCGDDAQLLRELELLVESHEEAGEFIERPALSSPFEILSKGEESLWAGRTIGQYRVLREIGRGGMGLVLLAVRADDQFEKQVAIKILRRGMDSEEIVRRFRNERQILASLDHPYIARLFDGGMTEDGLPYFVMEHIEGQPFDKYADEQRLNIKQRLELFRKVCVAVQYAHQNLVVHRDLKPSNILITRTGEPKLLDFGIAKVLSPELSASEWTRTEARMLTPDYASPEQVRGEKLTTRSDVYSLGVVLYELLTGHRPYRVAETAPHELARIICEQEPTKPSVAIKTVEVVERVGGGDESSSQITPEAISRARDTQPDRLRHLLSGDLDNIVLMALRKEQARRYESAEQLSADVKRYLDGLPVIAHKDTFAYRASKFIGRNKVGVTAAALVLLAIIAGLIGTIWQARLAQQQRDAAQAEKLKAERISTFLSTALSYSDPSMSLPGNKNRRDATINQMLDDVAPRIATDLADQPDARVALQRIVGRAYISQYRLDDAERYLSAALDTQLKIHGENHLETARILSVLGTLKVGKGEWAEAEETLRRATAIFRKQQQEGQQDVQAFTGALYDLGSIHWSKGNLDAAESAFNEALTFSSYLQGANRELIADAKVGLGYSRYSRGRLDEAVSLLREAIAEYRGLSNSRWKLSEALNPLGQVLTWRGEYLEALSVLRESAEISREFFGDDNAYRARSLYLQAAALCFNGDYAEAAKALDKAEELYSRITPDEKISAANNADIRNMILTRTGRAPEGEIFGRKAIELYQSSINRGSPSITLARIHLAESLTAQKKYEEAEKVLLEAYKDASEVQGASHWRTKDVARELVKLYDTWGKPDRAAEYRNKS
ncbi:MAG TPA: tetratricopeptide repeat protein [Pyrinomonadaceae bacterium]